MNERSVIALVVRRLTSFPVHAERGAIENIVTNWHLLNLGEEERH